MPDLPLLDRASEWLDAVVSEAGHVLRVVQRATEVAPGVGGAHHF